MKKIIKEFLRYFDKQTKLHILLLSTFLVFFIGIIDYLTGVEISFSIFYVIPISFCAWFTGKKRLGLLISGLSAVTWLFADLHAGHTYSHFLIPCWNMIVRLGFFVIITYILSELKKVLLYSQRLARTDSLTGVVNRLHFHELAEIELYKVRRFNRPVTIAYIDIDNFKKVNDTWGHSMGDTLLRTITSIMKENLRLTDTVARLGGDEFALILAETETDEAEIVIKKLNQRLIDYVKENAWPVTFSIGVITCKIPRHTVDELLKMVDNLMYSAKLEGKNRIKYEVIDR